LQARLTGVTAFPSVRRARVVVAELAEASGALAALSERLEQACVSLGVARQSRAYRPHVTLARARPPANLAKHLDCPAFAAAGVALSEIVLFRSTPSATGSVYTALARAAFVAPQ
jgi:2'-5' RNA ligase